jgi:hypothetical protein
MSAITPAGGPTTPSGTTARSGLRTREDEQFEATLLLAMVQRNPDVLQEQEEPTVEGGFEEPEGSAEAGKDQESRSIERPREGNRSETQSREPAAEPAPSKGGAAAEETPASTPGSARRGGPSAAGTAGSEKPAPEPNASQPAPAAATAAQPAEAENAPAPSAVRADMPVIEGLRAITLRVAGQMAATGAQSATAGAPAPNSTPAGNGSVLGTSGARSSTVIVPFQEAGGQEGRIRLALRGDSLQATILSSSGETVQRLGSQLADLQRALGERGFTDARLTVRQSGIDETTTSSSHSGRGSRPDDDRPGSDDQRSNRDAGRQGARGRNWRGGRY